MINISSKQIARRAALNLHSRTYAVASSSLSSDYAPDHVPYLVIGAGTGGLSVAHQLLNMYKQKGKPLKNGSLAIIDPSVEHHYQPGYTLVGSGLARAEDMVKPTENFIPSNSYWVKQGVSKIEPEKNQVTLSSGSSIKYDTLIVSAGIQMYPSKIPGLLEALQNRQAFSSYYFETSNEIFEQVKALKEGNAHFTMPAGPVKCAGGPQKIMWMAEDYWRSQNLRDKVNVHYYSPLPGLFGAQYYNEALMKLIPERGVNVKFETVLTGVDGDKKKASFKNNKTQETYSVNYDLLHAVPPMAPPEFIKSSGLANEGGFLDVNSETLRSTKYHNIWALGDCSSLPTSKTAAAIFSQAPVLINNIFAVNEQASEPVSKYSGYTACPLLIKSGKVMLAEFKYNGVPDQTFGKYYDQRVPSSFAWFLKTKFFRPTYWRFGIKGLWFGRDGLIKPSIVSADSRKAQAASPGS